MARKVVSYLRVSTDKQGRSGLGLEAQRDAVAAFLKDRDFDHVQEFVEVESGKNDARPKLQEALHIAKLTGALLVVAKLDRLSRNVLFLARLQESRVQFVCCDMPEANEFMIHIMAAMAQHERKLISDRTKAAMAAAKARGVTFGNPNGAACLHGLGTAKGVAAIKANADRHARDVLPVIQHIREGGAASLARIAAELNARGILTARGGQWHAMTVRNLLARCI